ncbi:energy-coupling factor transporter ATPase [Heyndrickxia sporothermodurans]|uniref:ABC transporter ATP-binding protein n=1 Tax=Heyndrickxia sporothermodurans TaxID=46224 RepID=UPI002E1E3915|nr:energy-coupling factor transporter ATPase [Heyndrickxia sporothermodurans]MED3655035.1 energy-coupling factor transporter ATPase [Heyndrickxia sporothermodurans]
MALLEAKNISFHYPEERSPALDNVSFYVNEGDFIVLCGASGSGKSTLLRLLKKEVSPHGKVSGDIYYNDQPIFQLDSEVAARELGMVFQDPENQLVMDQVMEELIFGMENIGFSTEYMRKKVAEMVHFFGLDDLLEKKTYEISGGQKQLVNLASILLLEPRILLLDEPTAQLDPVAAKEFIGMLHRMNEEFGITVIIAEHRLEELFALADRAIILEQGKVIFDSTPRNVSLRIGNNAENKLYSYLPSPAILYLEHSLNIQERELPLTVKEGKLWVKQLNIEEVRTNSKEEIPEGTPLLQMKNIDFQYTKDQRKILDRTSLSVFEGEALAIVGANGTGKSTLLKIMAGIEKPQGGSILYKGKRMKKHDPLNIGYLPQNPKLFFLHDTLEAELDEIIKQHKLNEGKTRAKELLEWFQLASLANRHPYDLSGGELQKAALAGVLLTNPKVLLIDEPTKGLDPDAKKRFGELLVRLREKGVTIVLITHDIEFAAQYATRCAMLFQGNITVTAPVHSFFSGNTFYTTTINRMIRGSNAPNVLTVEEARTKWRVIK